MEAFNFWPIAPRHKPLRRFRHTNCQGLLSVSSPELLQALLPRLLPTLSIFSEPASLLRAMIASTPPSCHRSATLQATKAPRASFEAWALALARLCHTWVSFFAFYESLKPAFAGVSLPLDSLGSGDAIAGVLASMMSKTAVFPLATVRKRLQVQGPTRAKYVHKNIPVYDTGVIRTLTSIAAREGVRSLYRGLTVGLIKAAPASAITMWTYERAIHSLQSFEVLEGKH